MRIRKKAFASVAVVFSLALALSSCSSTGGAKATQTSAAPAAGSASAGSGGTVATTKRYTIAMVTHETPGDTFWDKIRAGAQAAAAKDNIDLKYSNDPDATKQAALVQNAVASKVDGIATTLPTPNAMKAAVAAAVAAKIPVVAFNAGIEQYKALGALMYFGSDETVAGNTVGARITKEGGKHPLCVIQQQGSVALEARCAGVKAQAPGTENLQVNGADDNQVKATLQAKLVQDKSIDYIVTLGAPQAIDAVASVAAAGSKAKIATFDLNEAAATDIQSKAIEFSVDQQPYVQGYEAVDSLWLNLTNGNDLGGGKPVLTGPSIVDGTNIAKILPFVKNNTR